MKRRDIALLGIIGITWSGCFVILAWLVDLLMEKLFRGDSETLLSWLMDLGKSLFLLAVIFWLIVGTALIVAKLLERWKVRRNCQEMQGAK